MMGHAGAIVRPDGGFEGPPIRAATGGGRMVSPNRAVTLRALGRAPFSDMEGGLYRGWLSPAYRAAREHLAAWMTRRAWPCMMPPAI
jgi:hypothetical protein